MRFLILAASLAIFVLGCDAVAGNVGESSGCSDCSGVEPLVWEYDANPIRANQRYVGNRYNVGGKIERIERGGTLYAHHAGPLWNSDYDVTIGDGNVLGFIMDERNGWLLELDNGDWIEAYCLLLGFSEPEHDRPTIVVMVDCEAANDKPDNGKIR